MSEALLLRSLWFPALVIVLLAHCGGGASNASFNVEPEPRAITVGDRLALSIHPDGNLSGDAQWEVEEPYGGGLRNSQGDSTVYFAPEKAGTYHLTLRANRTDGRRMKETVAIQVLPIPTLEPASASVAPGGSVDFTANMKGLARNTVKWSVDEPNGGAISDEGHYQPPSRPGTYHVTATSTLAPDVSARATVVVGG